MSKFIEFFLCIVAVAPTLQPIHYMAFFRDIIRKEKMGFKSEEVE